MNPLNIPPTCPPGPPTDYLDQWIPLTPIEQMEQTDYDVLIIGTGAGGSAVLWRLCEQLGATGKRIGIVEAGDLLLPMHAQNIPTLDIERADNYSLIRKFRYRLGRGFPNFRQQPCFTHLGEERCFGPASLLACMNLC